MYNFLSRLGRLFIGITVLVAVIAIFGVSTDFGALVSHHQSASSMSCAVSSAGVGQQLVTSGHGFAPNSQYLLSVKTPAGTGTTTASTDGSGAFTVNAWATWSGTYSASVWTTGGGSRQMASCSSVTV